MVEEDEIDLRPYAMTVLRRWKLVLGVTVLATAVAAAVSLATPATYEATSTVAIAAPGAQPAPAAKAYADLATGDKVIAAVAQDLAGSAPGAALSAADLKGKLKAVQGTDTSQVVLKVQDTDPSRTTTIADAWTTTFVRISRSTFDTSEDTLRMVAAHMKAAQEQLRQSEADLTAQERRDSVAVLQAQLEAQQKILTDLYVTKADLQAASEGGIGLRSRLSRQNPAALSAPSDDFTLTWIQMKVLRSPIQFQVPAHVVPSGQTVGSQVDYVDGLMALIGDRIADTDNQIATAQSGLLDLQTKLHSTQDEQAPLLARRDSARETIKSLDLKAVQVRVTAETGISNPRVIEASATPATALPRGTARNVAVVAMLGLMVGIAVAIGISFLRPQSTAVTTRPHPSAQD